MNSLARVFLTKIVLTVLFWCIPLLALPTDAWAALGMPIPAQPIFLRLLGMAYCALVVGYGFAYVEARRQRRPLAMIWVGIVSNGGASLLLTWHGLAGAWSAWGPPAQWSMWASALLTAAITFALWQTGLRGYVAPLAEPHQ